MQVPVDVELAGAGDGGGARFLLRRTWRGQERTVTVAVAPGGALRASVPCDEGRTTLIFDPHLRLDAVHMRAETERTPVRVPRFHPDGHVERGADGSALTEQRDVPRERRVLEADGVGADGTRYTWSRTISGG